MDACSVGDGDGWLNHQNCQTEAGANGWTSASDPITLIGHRTGMLAVWTGCVNGLINNK